MTPEDLRADVPATDRVAYLNTGASGPSPRRVVDAVETCQERHAFDSPAEAGMYEYAFDEFDRAREAVAGFVGADPAEVALTQSTTDGMNRVMGALDWTPGDVVVRTDVEHSAGILPWRRLRERRDVEVRVVETEAGRLDPAALREAAEGARLVCFSAVTWTHGTRLPVTDLVEAAHDAGAAVLVDAVQAPGQVPVDVSAWDAEFVAGAGHKWLLGPWGAGFLYVREDVAERVRPDRAGYRSVPDPEAPGVDFHAGARRFEVGTVSPAPYAGLCEAIALVEDVGLDAVRSRIERLTDHLKDGLGDRLVGPREYETGLVAFEVDDPEGFVERADERDVKVRSLPTGHVRASVHAFNTEAELDRLLGLLE